MFRRWANRMSNALSAAVNEATQENSFNNNNNNNNNNSNNSIETLRSILGPTSQGISNDVLQDILASTGGNVEQAMEIVLAMMSSSSSSAPSAPPIAIVPAATHMEQDDDLQRALQASLMESNAPPKTKTVTAISTTSTTTTTQRSIQAHHPNVQIPSTLKQQPPNEQVIVRCVERFKKYPLAVDALAKAVTALHENPTNPLYQTIDTSTPAFQRSLANVPGVSDLLHALHYHASKSSFILELTFLDAAACYVAKSVLETAKTSMEYQHAKAHYQFHKELNRLVEMGDSSEQEAIDRANYLSKCPSEPTSANATTSLGNTVQVSFGDPSIVASNCESSSNSNNNNSNNSATAKKSSWKKQTPTTAIHPPISRKFDGDDTLEDVVHWLGGFGGPQFLSKLIDTKEWILCDKHDLSKVPLTIQFSKDEFRFQTLQRLNCWPSGSLVVLPNPEMYLSSSFSNK